MPSTETTAGQKGTWLYIARVADGSALAAAYMEGDRPRCAEHDAVVSLPLALAAEGLLELAREVDRIEKIHGTAHAGMMHTGKLRVLGRKARAAIAAAEGTAP